MNILQKYSIWLRRCRHCRGFGIQSPTDYAFVRYVINEHWPYYAYCDLKVELPAVTSDCRKLAELYFRIANWLQPSKTVVVSEYEAVYSRYVHTGCSKTNFVSPEILFHDDDKHVLIILGRCADRLLALKCCELCTERSLIVVEDIYGTNKSLWNEMAGSDSVRISYDLYYAGIAMFDKARYKTNYKINF